MKLYCGLLGVVLSLTVGAQHALTDRADLEAFVDGLMAAHLEIHHVPGATLAIVYQGEVILKKGYGHADLATKLEVNPDTSMFMIGSISKPFTWTAAMQLVEAGKLDLSADVNAYMPDVQFPNTFDKPITFLDLMNHTPGLEDRALGLFAKSHESVTPLSELLQAEPLPARVRTPGVLASYSNHGAAVAGYIVELLHGVPWEDCIERQILQPLGMGHTNVRQPAMEDLPVDLATGYTFDLGTYEAGDYEYVPLAPAGCISSSAADMAAFMIMHLNLGAYEGGRIFSEETAGQMQQQSHAHHPRASGMAHGFMEYHRNGIRFIGHGGDTLLFHSLMMMAPEHEFGIFVSYNAVGGATARDQLLNAIVDRYFPASETPLPEASDEAIARARSAAGTYVLTKRNFSTLESLLAFVQPFPITALENGNLLIPGDPAMQFAEIEPYVYKNVLNESMLITDEESGQIVRAYLADLPVLAAERVTGLKNPVNHQITLFLSLAIVSSVLVLVPLGAFIAWHTGSKPTVSIVIRGAALLTAVLVLTFCVGIVSLLSAGNDIVYGLPGWSSVVLSLPWLIMVGVAMTAIAVLTAWVRRRWSLWHRLYYTGVSLGGVGFLWFVSYWNLFGT